MHLSAWSFSIPTLWSSSAELSRTLSVEGAINGLKSSSGFRLPEFALENSQAHSQLIPLPAYFWDKQSSLMAESSFYRTLLQFPILVGILPGGQCAGAVPGEDVLYRDWKHYKDLLCVYEHPEGDP